jgi:hypothetical protein
MATQQIRTPRPKSWIWLRIAAIITFLYAAGHTSGMPWTPATGPNEAPLLVAMKTTHFDAMGAQRSYWDFYFGFGVTVSLFMFVQACVLWQLATLERRQPGLTRPIIATFCIAFIATACLVWKYFFVIPLVMALAIALCFGAAFYLSPRPPAP